MSGIQEILIIVLIILGILFIPRMTGSPAAVQQKATFPRRRLSGFIRLVIVVSVLWPLGFAVYYRLWQGHSTAFYVYGLGPVIVGWSLYWVMAGFIKKNGKRGIT
ncbi:MAG: hypothetical protein DSY89_08535 [Deltaproteobacteria bacterium]|nr:MAG: hypothetical protein DSY89_08535 [Deltaproteobacteria bacterium]